MTGAEIYGPDSEVVALYDEYTAERWVAMQEGDVVVHPTIARGTLERLLSREGINPAECDIRRRVVRFRIEVLADGGGDVVEESPMPPLALFATGGLVNVGPILGDGS